MKYLCWLFLLAMFFAPEASNAASFDCTHARSTLEVLICADPELSTLDGQVGQAYNQARIQFSQDSDESNDLLDDQRQFLKERGETCPISFKPELSEGETNAIIACLKDRYTLRLSALQKQLAANQPDNSSQETPIATPQLPKPVEHHKQFVSSQPVNPPVAASPPVPAYQAATANQDSSPDIGKIIGFVVLGWLILKVFNRPKRKPQANALPSYKPSQKAQNNALPKDFGITVTLSTVRASETASKTNGRWIPPTESVTVAGHVISGGNIYIYTGKTSSNYSTSTNYSSEAAFIYPSLPVAKKDADTAGQHMGYYPSYGSIRPECRLAYLQWLSKGRNDPTISIGYVFLYFYGIERRIIVDTPSNEEIATLMSEVERLRSIYSSNGSFDGYSNRLLEAAKFVITCRNPDKFTSIAPELESDVPKDRMLKMMALAYRLKNNEPLPFEWAMLGYLIGSGEWLRGPTKRVFPVFLALMRKRIEKKWPQGFLSRYRKDARALTYSFKGASSSLYVADIIQHMGMDKLLDPQAYIWTTLTKIADQAQEDIAPYARAVGRDLALADNLEGISLLPAELADERFNELGKELLPWLAEIAQPIAQVKFSELTMCMLKKSYDVINHHKLRAIAEILAHFGYGFEPDPDFRQPKGKFKEIGVIFDARGLKNLRAKASASYPLAMAIATLVAGIAGASETGLGESEIRWLGWIQKTLTLPETEYRRLRAYLEWLTMQRLTMTQINRALGEIPENQRDTIARFAAAVAAADGVIEKTEVAFLEKVYDQLGIERNKLYGTLHDMAAEHATPASEPVSVERPASNSGNVYKIPKAPFLEAKTGTAGKLNQKRISKILEETNQVSGILTSVFNEASSESDIPAPEEKASEEATDSRFVGLDQAHTSLALRLIEQTEWKRAAFEGMAKELGLMPDGALEVINEWAFDNFEEPFIEDGDTLEINRTLIKKAA